MHPENIKINILLRHCNMYMYASEGHPERMTNPTAQAQDPALTKLKQDG